MTRRSLLASLLLCLSQFATSIPGLAQAGRDAGDDPLDRLEQEGWTAMQEGIFLRQLRPDEVETFVFGVEGFTWKLRDLRGQLQNLRREYQARPTPELRRAIVSHRQAIASTDRMIERARIAEAGGKSYFRPDSCSLKFAFDAVAAAKVNVRGTWAAASAELNPSESCAYEGEVYAYAIATATVNGAPTTMIVTDGPRTGLHVSATADAQRNGGPDCESYAYSYVTSNSLYPTSYSTSKTNTSCPAAVIWEGECETINWTVSVSGGTPPYTVSIYRDSVFQRYGTSYSEQFCFDEAYEQNYSAEMGEYVELGISARVTDSAGQSRTLGHETTLRYRWWLY